MKNKKGFHAPKRTIPTPCLEAILVDLTDPPSTTNTQLYTPVNFGVYLHATDISYDFGDPTQTIAPEQASKSGASESVKNHLNSDASKSQLPVLMQ